MAPSDSWLIDGGEMGELIRAKDWSRTPLGPIASWPPSLRTTVNLCLASRLPTLIAWGPERVMLYNDVCRALCGDSLLGQGVREAGPLIGGLFESAFAGQSHLLENHPFFIPRHGFLEEAFFSSSVSPIRDERGQVAGVLSVATETTATVLEARRTRTLRDVAASLASARTPREVLTLAARTLEAAGEELPFTLFYLREPRDGALRWVSGTGLAPGTPAAPSVLTPGEDAPASWPFEEVVRTRRAVQVHGLRERFGPLVGGPYPEPSQRAVVLPLLVPGQEAPAALLVAGVSPRLALDEACLGFLERLASSMGTALAQVRALQQAHQEKEGYREQLHQLFMSSPIAVAILTGPDQVFEFVNAKYETFTRQSSLVGRRFRDVFPELEGKGFEELLNQVYRTGEPFSGQEVAARLDRLGNGLLDEGFFNFSFHPYRAPDGQVRGVVAFIVEATEWLASRQQAEQRAAELEAVLQSIPDNICIADATGSIRSHRMEHELMVRTGIEEACARALQGEASTREVRVPGKSGEERIIRSATAPVHLRGQIVGAVSINVDLTERKRAEAEREVLLASEQAARMEAEQANRRKDEFLARISHELATPLVGMRLWLELLQSDESKRPEALIALRQCTQTQSKLVHDLLDTARALNGKLNVSLEACEPGEPVQAAASAIRPLAEHKGVSLKVSLRQTPLVLADPERLQQVVSNLLGNAVKFTPEGGKVEVRVEPERDGVGIVVRDTGKGFPADFQSRIFTPFRQEEEGTTRSTGGLGLGLAIVRQLVELHGGKVWAESPGRGQGATFTVWLPPLEEDAGGLSYEAATAEMGRQLEGVRLLLVEDDVLTRMAVLSVFEQQGAEVHAVGSAAAALALMLSTHFDAMLCDIAMPGEDGYSLIRKVRALDSPARLLPAAAFTAHMREEDRNMALLAGFQAHIPKSMEPAQLIAQVRLLANSRPVEE